MSLFTKKIVVLALFIALIIPLPSSAATREEMLVQIQQLQALIAQLTEMLAVQQFQADNSQVEESGCLYLTKYMYTGKDDGVTGGDVSRLQQYLAKDPAIYPEGQISGYFGDASTRAVRRFQEKYEVVGKDDPEYGKVLDKTILFLKRNCSPSDVKTTFSDSEPIPTLIAPNGGTYNYQDDLVVIVHVYNTSAYGASVWVSATGGHFGDSQFGLGSVEIAPGFSGQVNIPVSKLNRNQLRIGEEYTFVVNAADKFYGQNTPNVDYSDGKIRITGTSNTLTLEESHPCYTENYPCWASIKPEYIPAVRVITTSSKTGNNGNQGIFTAEVEFKATATGDIYIPEVANGISLNARRTTGTTLVRPETVSEQSIIASDNSREIEFKGKTYYRIEAGETARLTIQLLYVPEYEGYYSASIDMIGYRVDLSGTDFIFRPDPELPATKKIYIDGPLYDRSVEQLGLAL